MKLAAYLKANGITSAAFGRSVDLSKQTMFKYVHGVCFPPPSALRKIKEATSGQVTAEDFVDQHSGAPSKPRTPAEVAA